MLDRDDFLPEEQVRPELVQKLRTLYQMAPQEKQVLVQVRERLAGYARHLSEPIQVEEPARLLRLVSRVSPGSQPARLRQRWLRGFKSLAAALCVVLLVGALALTFAVLRRSSSTTGVHTIRLLLVPAEKGVVLSQDELMVTRAILSQRFSSFGLPEASVQATTANGHPAILVELPHFGGNEGLTINTLLENGVLEFWDTGFTRMNRGTTLDPGRYTQYNPGDRPRFTGQDLDPNSLAVTEDQAGRPLIDFSMKGDAIQRFRLFTAKNIGHFLTITLDGKVLESAVIQSPITGQTILVGPFTQQQARALVAALRYGSLPVELKQQG